MVRVRSGMVQVPIEPDLLAPMLFVYFFWALLFFLVGLYRPFYAASRFDELALLFKTISFGCLFLFFVIFFDDAGTGVRVSSRLLIVIYWAILLGCVGSGRLVLRSIQRRLLINGIGVHKTIVIGTPARARQLRDASSASFASTGDGQERRTIRRRSWAALMISPPLFRHAISAKP
jgi:FlaA1/EpsC-like NDP-sugar epimerase